MFLNFIPTVHATPSTQGSSPPKAQFQTTWELTFGRLSISVGRWNERSRSRNKRALGPTHGSDGERTSEKPAGGKQVERSCSKNLHVENWNLECVGEVVHVENMGVVGVVVVVVERGCGSILELEWPIQTLLTVFAWLEKVAVFAH